MEIKQKRFNSQGIKFFVEKEGQEVARAYLYLMTNDLHDVPFGFMEDVFVDEKYRGQKIGTKLVRAIIDEAKKNKCYKLIATSRYAREKVHELYSRLGFEDWGKEFRINL